MRAVSGHHKKAIGAAGARYITGALPGDWLYCHIGGHGAQPGGQEARQAGLHMNVARQAGLRETGFATGIAAERAQQRLDKKRERNHGRYRIAGQPEEVNLAILHRKGRVLTPAMKKFIEILGLDSMRLLPYPPVVPKSPLTKPASAYQTLSAWTS